MSRASRPESIDKLGRAGSNRMVSPYGLSGVRMASLSMQPAMIEFVDMISVAPDLRIEELVIGDLALRGPEVRDVCRPYQGVMLLALKRPAGELLVPPLAESVLGEGDVVIAVGQVKVLNQLAEGESEADGAGTVRGDGRRAARVGEGPHATAGGRPGAAPGGRARPHPRRGLAPVSTWPWWRSRRWRRASPGARCRPPWPSCGWAVLQASGGG